MKRFSWLPFGHTARLAGRRARVSRVVLALLAFLVTVSTVGCVAPLYYVEDENEPEVYVPDPPPPTRAEVPPPPPGRYHVWIPGRWAWDVRANRYAWRPGVYRRLRHPTHRYWVPGAWASTPRGYVYVPGRWR